MGEGGGKQRGKKGEVERGGKEREMKNYRENCCYAAWDSLQSQMGVEESRRAGTWSSWGEGKTPKAKPPCYTILTLGLCLSCLFILPDYPDYRNPLTNPVSIKQGTKLSQGNTVT